MKKLHPLDLIIKSLQSFECGERSGVKKIEILMAPDVFNSISDVQYFEFIGWRRFIDRELPEGHIRIIGTTRHGESRMLSRVKY